MTPIEEFSSADALLNKCAYDEATAVYLKLRAQHSELAAFCDYRLATISNNTGDPMTACDLYYKAFTARPNLALNLYGESHLNRNYVYEGKKEEKESTSCPLCNSSEITPKWCYSLPEAGGFSSVFNPIRVWMYCNQCHHMVARHYPENLFIYNDEERSPNTAFFSYYSSILSKIAQYTSGITLFEVGIGGCECLLVAQEMGFDTFGIDVIDKHVQMARDKFGLNAVTADFVEYQSKSKYDILIMGDVIEHVSNPVAAIQKANSMLADNGVLWVSTPNFDSAFSVAVGHNDPMKKQAFHLNYFSRYSFFMLLEMCGLAPVDYCVSSHYNGSMEVIAVKANS